MTPEAEIVATLMRWAQTVQMVDSLRGAGLPGPRAPGCPLGRLIKRADVATALSIVRDMNRHDIVLLDEALETRLVQQQAGDVTFTRSRGAQDSIELAEKLLMANRRYHDSRKWTFMELATRAPSWKSLEISYPGRDWASLRDDFEALATIFWRSEKFFLSHAVDFVVKVDRIQELRH